MPTLLDIPSDESRMLSRAIVKGFIATEGDWPIWQYIYLLLEEDGIDGEKMFVGLPTWNYGYRSIWPNSGTTCPQLNEVVGLSMHGLVHSNLPETGDLINVFLASINLASEAQLRVVPDPKNLVQVILDGSEFTAQVNERAGTSLTDKQLLSLLKHEPATWRGFSEIGTSWSWDLTGVNLRQYRNIKTGEEYLATLEELVGLKAASSSFPILPPMALPEAFDHLDLAWRLVKKERLINVSRASIPARLSQDVNSVDEFESRCSALSDLLGNLNLPQDTLDSKSTPLTRMKVELDGLLGDDAKRAKDAVDTLRRVQGVRNAQQHSNSAIRNQKDLAKLGLIHFGSDWAGAWDHLRAVAFNALTTIRESLETLLDQEFEAKSTQV